MYKGTKPKKICKFYPACTVGEACQYQHIDSTQALAAAIFAPAVEKEKMPCTYFLQNKCRNGLQCAFSHDTQKVADPPINN